MSNCSGGSGIVVVVVVVVIVVLVVVVLFEGSRDSSGCGCKGYRQ